LKVIFIKDVNGQGKEGEIKEVKDGYANNYLIKKGLAVSLTKESKKRLDEEKILKKKKEHQQEVDFLKIKKQIEDNLIIFKVKTGREDKVFGSISSKQISNELAKIGIDIDKKKIIINNSIANLGFHNVEIDLCKNIKAILKIELKKEQW